MEKHTISEEEEDEEQEEEQEEEVLEAERGLPGTSAIGRNVSSHRQRGESAGEIGTRTGSSGGLENKLAKFWQEMMDDVKASGGDVAEFKMQQLPLARIKKIMKSDEDVRMISAEAPVLFAKACEFFILEMTLRAWHVAEENNRRTLTRQDISDAVNRTEVWDFLADTVPADQGPGAGQEKQFGMPMNMGAQRAMPQMGESYQYMDMGGGASFPGMHPMSMPMAYPQHMFMQQGNVRGADGNQDGDQHDDQRNESSGRNNNNNS